MEQHVLLASLGNAVEVLKSPIEHYRPRVVVLFTNLLDKAQQVVDNLTTSWSKDFIGAESVARVLVKEVEAFTASAVTDYIEKIGEAMVEVRGLPEMKGQDPRFIVGTVGGTNLMAIGAAFSAMHYGLEAYYSTPPFMGSGGEGGHLTLKLDFFTDLMNAQGVMDRAHQGKWDVLLLLLEEGGLSTKKIAEMRGTSPQNINGIVHGCREKFRLVETSHTQPPIHTLTLVGRLMASRIAVERGM